MMDKAEGLNDFYFTSAQRYKVQKYIEITKFMKKYQKLKLV